MTNPQSQPTPRSTAIPETAHPSANPSRTPVARTSISALFWGTIACLAAIIVLGIFFLVRSRYAVPDAEIVQNITTSFSKDESLRKCTMDVTAHHGIVTIVGLVNTEADKAKAIGVASLQGGVKRVIGQLVLAPHPSLSEDPSAPTNPRADSAGRRSFPNQQRTGAPVIASVMPSLPPATLDSAIHWVQTNGPYGGNVTALALSGPNLFAGNDRGVFFFATDGTGWKVVRSGLPSALVWSLVVDGTNLYAATSGGVYLSTNNGTSWKATGLEGINVWGVGVNGRNLYAGTNAGVFLSTNNGKKWKAINSGLRKGELLTRNDVGSFAVIGTNLFAGTGGDGVFLSTDNGKSWTAVNSGLTNTVVWSLVVIGTNLFAGTDDGVFLLAENGTSWQALKSGFPRVRVRSLAVSGTNFYAGTQGMGVFLSPDNGTSWRAVNAGLMDTTVFSLAVNGTNLFAGTKGGVFVSTDKGASSSAQADQPATAGNAPVITTVAPILHGACL